jgi:hypothetical protein
VDPQQQQQLVPIQRERHDLQQLQTQWMQVQKTQMEELEITQQEHMAMIAECQGLLHQEYANLDIAQQELQKRQLKVEERHEQQQQHQ